MVTVKCVDCGKEYELEPGENLSDYQCECEGNLEYKADLAHKTLKEKKTIKTKKKISKGLIILILIVVALLAVVTSGLMFSQIGNPVNKSNNTTPATPTIAYQTYTGNGLTFNYPAGWQPFSNLDSPSRWGFGDPIVAFYYPSNNHTEANVDTYFYIKRRDVSSLDEQLSDYRSDIAAIGQTEVSERNITVNGMKAVELIKTWHNDNEQYMALTVHIEAVPGSAYYRIGCVVPADRFNSTLPEFRLVENSFKLQ